MSMLLLDNANLHTYVRGRGPLKVALVGLDSAASEMLDRFVNDTCPLSSVSLLPLLQRSKLFVIPEYSPGDHLPYLRASSVDAVILFAEGPAKSVIFSAGENTPHHFDQKEFDDSLVK